MKGLPEVTPALLLALLEDDELLELLEEELDEAAEELLLEAALLELDDAAEELLLEAALDEALLPE